MGLKKDSIEIYQIQKKEIEKRSKIDSAKFAESSIDLFKEMFGDEYDIVIKEASPDHTILVVDGLEIMATSGQGIKHFTLMLKCDKCGDNYTENIHKIVDIGKALECGHNKFDCERSVRSKQEPKPRTIDEEFLDTFRRFIQDVEENY